MGLWCHLTVCSCIGRSGQVRIVLCSGCQKQVLEPLPCHYFIAAFARVISIQQDASPVVLHGYFACCPSARKDIRNNIARSARGEDAAPWQFLRKRGEVGSSKTGNLHFPYIPAVALPIGTAVFGFRR